MEMVRDEQRTGGRISSQVVSSDADSEKVKASAVYDSTIPRSHDPTSSLNLYLFRQELPSSY